MTNTARKLLLGLLGGSSDPAASFTVTTTGAQTLTINGLTVSASTTVDWGDGSSDVYTGAGARTHAYAGAGTWQVRILQPLNVTSMVLLLPGVQMSVNSRQIGKMKNITSVDIRVLPVGSSIVLNSADLSALPIGGQFYVQGNSDPVTGVWNSSDLRNWRPGLFIFPISDTTGTFDFADVAAWNPQHFQLVFKGGGYSPIVLKASDFSGWIATDYLALINDGLSQAQVDAVLLGLYTAAQSRTTTGGTISVGGTNAAPSGVYAAECPPTTGKAAAYELINDSCGVIAAGETWTSITVTGGLP
jgi:hypothetical protein